MLIISNIFENVPLKSDERYCYHTRSYITVTKMSLKLGNEFSHSRYLSGTGEHSCDTSKLTIPRFRNTSIELVIAILCFFLLCEAPGEKSMEINVGIPQGK
jgi:hypothetical protein